MTAQTLPIKAAPKRQTTSTHRHRIELVRMILVAVTVYTVLRLLVTWLLGGAA